MQEIIAKLLATGELDAVITGAERPEKELQAANRHYESALRILDSDPEGAFQLLYDSARKALQALLAAEGIRVRRPPNGNHYTFVKVANGGFVDERVWAPLDWMRKVRNQTEYPEPELLPASATDSHQAVAHVTAMLEDAKSRLAKQLR
jgi:hypothetical protein